MLAAATRATRVLILTTFDLDEYVYDALRAGASGFLLKDAPPDATADRDPRGRGRRGAARAAITRRLIAEYARRPAPTTRPARSSRSPPASARCSRLLARGLSNSEIAAALFLSEATVKTHVARSWPSWACGTGCRPSSWPTSPVWSRLEQLGRDASPG